MGGGEVEAGTGQACPTRNSEPRANRIEAYAQNGRKVGLDAIKPAAGVSPFPVQEGRIRYLSETEIPALLEACEKQVTSPWLQPLVELALNTGARQGELLQLRWEDRL